MSGFYARKGETRNETYNRIYGTDNALKQNSIKRQERALHLLKVNFYKRQIEAKDTTIQKKRNYKHKSLGALLDRFKNKNSAGSV